MSCYLQSLLWATSLWPSTTNINCQLITRLDCHLPPGTFQNSHTLCVPLVTQTYYYILSESTTHVWNAPISIHRPIPKHMRKNPLGWNWTASGRVIGALSEKIWRSSRFYTHARTHNPSHPDSCHPCIGHTPVSQAIKFWDGLDSTLQWPNQKHRCPPVQQFPPIHKLLIEKINKSSILLQRNNKVDDTRPGEETKKKTGKNWVLPSDTTRS